MDQPPELPDDLIAGWRTIAGASTPSDAAMRELAARYGEPHRRYHGVDHLIHVVRRAKVLIDAERTTTPDEAHAILLAAWFHDAVYDPRAADNERRSADLASQQLAELGVATEQRRAVERLVMATRDHRPTRADEAILLDADLAILGAPPDTYDAYVRHVRAEYAHVSDADWRVGRPQILQHFLAGPVFSTPTAALDNGQAMANLTRELAHLNG